MSATFSSLGIVVAFEGNLQIHFFLIVLYSPILFIYHILAFQSYERILLKRHIFFERFLHGFSYVSNVAATDINED